MIMRVATAKELCRNHSVRQVCRLLGVNRSRLYYALSPKRDLTPLCRFVETIRVTLPQAGVPTLYEIVKRYHLDYSRREVSQAYRTLGILGKRPLRKPKTTNSRHPHPVYPDLVKGLRIKRPNQVWATDVTWVRISGRWAYLALIEDLYTRRIVGWSLSKSNDLFLCVFALEMALDHGTPEIHHSDQDTSYASPKYIRRLLDLGIAVSMTMTGSPWDNGFVERLNRTLKHEEVLLSEYQSLEEARTNIASWVELYNHGRPHSALDYCTPMEFYEMYEAEPKPGEQSP